MPNIVAVFFFFPNIPHMFVGEWLGIESVVGSKILRV